MKTPLSFANAISFRSLATHHCNTCNNKIMVRKSCQLAGKPAVCAASEKMQREWKHGRRAQFPNEIVSKLKMEWRR